MISPSAVTLPSAALPAWLKNNACPAWSSPLDTKSATVTTLLDLADELGVKYVIWDQQIDTGSGFEAMEDRGGDTANHKDHVHISFEDSAGSGSPDLGKCA